VHNMTGGVASVTTASIIRVGKRPRCHESILRYISYLRLSNAHSLEHRLN
jgi:hypothetical protein